MARTAFLITIIGQVQGVGFRAFVRRHAKNLGIDGWVRNRHDGSVEIMAIAEPHLIDQLRETFDRAPALAKIEQISLRGAEDDGTTGFKETPTT